MNFIPEVEHNLAPYEPHPRCQDPIFTSKELQVTQCDGRLETFPLPQHFAYMFINTPHELRPIFLLQILTSVQ